MSQGPPKRKWFQIIRSRRIATSIVSTTITFREDGLRLFPFKDVDLLNAQDVEPEEVMINE